MIGTVTVDIAVTTIRDILPQGASVWAKADWEWRWEGRVVPFMAYTNAKTAEKMASRMARDDLVLVVRVLDKKLSNGQPGLIEGVLQVNPADRRPTTAYLPEDAIEAVIRKTGKFWSSAIGGTKTWEVLGTHNAADVLPITRSRFARSANENGLSRVDATELNDVLDLQVQEVLPDVVPEAAAWSTLEKRRYILASRAARDLYKQRRDAGLIPPESAHERGAHEETGRSTDISDSKAAIKDQGDACPLCGGMFGNGALRPMSIVDGARFQIVHAACRAMEKHAPGDTYTEGERNVVLSSVAKHIAERHGRVPLIALGANLRRNGRLVCDVCENDWAGHHGVTPDSVGRLFEVHHLIGIATGKQNTDPLADVAVVCALCHKLAHGGTERSVPRR